MKIFEGNYYILKHEDVHHHWNGQCIVLNPKDHTANCLRCQIPLETIESIASCGESIIDENRISYSNSNDRMNSKSFSKKRKLLNFDKNSSFFKYIG